MSQDKSLMDSLMDSRIELSDTQKCIVPDTKTKIISTIEFECNLLAPILKSLDKCLLKSKNKKIILRIEISGLKLKVYDDGKCTTQFIIPKIHLLNQYHICDCIEITTTINALTDIIETGIQEFKPDWNPEIISNELVINTKCNVITIVCYDTNNVCTGTITNSRFSYDFKAIKNISFANEKYELPEKPDIVVDFKDECTIRSVAKLFSTFSNPLNINCTENMLIFGNSKGVLTFDSSISIKTISEKGFSGKYSTTISNALANVLECGSYQQLKISMKKDSPLIFYVKLGYITCVISCKPS